MHLKRANADQSLKALAFCYDDDDDDDRPNGCCFAAKSGSQTRVVPSPSIDSFSFFSFFYLIDFVDFSKVRRHRLTRALLSFGLFSLFYYGRWFLPIVGVNCWSSTSCSSDYIVIVLYSSLSLSFFFKSRNACMCVCVFREGWGGAAVFPKKQMDSTSSNAPCFHKEPTTKIKKGRHYQTTTTIKRKREREKKSYLYEMRREK